MSVWRMEASDDQPTSKLSMNGGVTCHKYRASPQALSPGHEILVTRQRYKKPLAMARCEVAHSLSSISHYTLR